MNAAIFTYLGKFFRSGGYMLWIIIKNLPKYVPYIYFGSILIAGITRSVKANNFGILGNVLVTRIVLPLEGLSAYIMEWSTTTGFFPKTVILLGVFGSVFMVVWFVRIFKKMIGFFADQSDSPFFMWGIAIVIFILFQLFGTTYLGLTEQEQCIEDWEFEIEHLPANLTNVTIAKLSDSCPKFERARLTPLKGFIDLYAAVRKSQIFGYYDDAVDDAINATSAPSGWKAGILDLFII